MRRAVASLDIRAGERSVALSVSIGVSALRAADSLDGLFALADAALYRAKAAGRNRVEIAHDAACGVTDRAPAAQPVEARAA